MMLRRFPRRAAPMAIALASALTAVLAAAGAAWAQGPITDEPPAIKQQQDLRFPQPVRVGALVHWPVIAAGGHYKKLGDIIGVFQPTDDDPVLVFRYGADIFGRGGRPIATSLLDVALVGAMVKVADLGPSDLAKLPTFKAEKGAFLMPDDVVKIGVDKKY